MTLPLIFIIFWMFGMIWGAYHWYNDNESSHVPSRKANFKQKLKNRKSTTSIESMDISENEDFPKCVKRKIRQENKTRWPSRTSFNE
ncbi:hypothetical protein V1477_007348 [Vespula maculifrons]|uniref:Secreted protein n=1 Tax=Vespula maculifrons TaxID=7453 RepID=A0ABD2CI97_VESMC